MTGNLLHDLVGHIQPTGLLAGHPRRRTSRPPTARPAGCGVESGPSAWSRGDRRSSRRSVGAAEVLAEVDVTGDHLADHQADDAQRGRDHQALEPTGRPRESQDQATEESNNGRVASLPPMRCGASCSRVPSGTLKATRLGRWRRNGRGGPGSRHRAPFGEPNLRGCPSTDTVLVQPLQHLDEDGRIATPIGMMRTDQLPSSAAVLRVGPDRPEGPPGRGSPSLPGRVRAEAALSSSPVSTSAT